MHLGRTEFDANLVHMRSLTIRLSEGMHEELREAASKMNATINDLVVEALTGRLDERTVTFLARNTNEASRLRRLAREHGSLGPPFPNNDTEMSAWEVCEPGTDGWQPVNRHSLPSVGVEVKSVFGGPVDCGYPLGHLTGRRTLCPRCGG
jgi:hypothetical protein